MYYLIQFGEMKKASSTRRIVRIAKRFTKKAHILHVTAKEEVDFLSQNKAITFEITPQHPTIYAPDCYNKLGTYAQMNPPIRDKSHYNRLWYAVRNIITTQSKIKIKIPKYTLRNARCSNFVPVMLNHVKGNIFKQLINLLVKIQ